MAIRTTTPALYLAALILAAVPAVSKADFNTMPGIACTPSGPTQFGITSAGAFVNNNPLFALSIYCALDREKSDDAAVKAIEVRTTGVVQCAGWSKNASGNPVQFKHAIRTVLAGHSRFDITNMKTVARGTAYVECLLDPGASLISVVWRE